jgi:hypothetical protein
MYELCDPAAVDNSSDCFHSCFSYIYWSVFDCRFLLKYPSLESLRMIMSQENISPPLDTDTTDSPWVLDIGKCSSEAINLVKLLPL